MAGKIDKKYHDSCLFRDDEAQEEPESANQTHGQVNDVYNLIIDFFSRYYDKGDFFSKKRYGAKNNYMIPYNGEEVLLHWANHDQYYIKTDEFFKNYSFKVGDSQVSFKIKEAETESNNNKGERKYFIPANGHAIEAQKGNVLTIWFQYRALSEEEKKKYITRNVQDELIQEIIKKIDAKNNGWKAALLKSNGDGSSLLEKHLKRYVNKNTCDFFIHKHLRGFLNHELEFFIKNEVLDLDDMELMDEQHLRLSMAKAKAFRGICQRIIEFLAQIEEFQKRLFEKKKFVIRTDYCLTLDKVPEDFYGEISGNEKQVEEWKFLFKLEEATDSSLSLGRINGKKLDVDFLKSHRFLVIDTKFFPQDFKDRLLARFENLSEEIGGLIIKSENFQALDLLMGEFQEKVKCIYIDQPYNTGDDEFNYKDDYQHSSWLSMMWDRLLLARNILCQDGLIFVSIDDNEQARLKMLLDNIFGEANILAELVWDLGTGTAAGHFVRSHEYIFCYAKNKQLLPNFKYEGDEDIISERAIKKVSKGNPLSSIEFPAGIEIEDVDNIEFEGTIGGSEIVEIEGKMVFENGKLRYPVLLKAGWAMRDQIISWLRGEETYDSKGQKVLRFFFDKNGKLQYEKIRGTINPKTILRNIASTRKGTAIIEDIFGERMMAFPKPVELISYLIEIVTEKKGQDNIADFFAGSGTTAHAVLNLNAEDGGNRKYILVEMGGYFDTLLKPRIQKLMFSKEWKDGKPVSKEGIKHIFKYQYLEQYEDTLNNIIFRDLSNTAQETLSEFSDYFLRYMLDYETRESPARLAANQFEKPFDYKLKVTSGGEERIETVDLVETFNYLLGLEVERIRVFENNKRKYRVVFGRKGNDKIAVIWRSIEGIDYEIDRDFVEKTILKNEKFSSIYINGEDSLIPSAEPIEPEFKRLMGA